MTTNQICPYCERDFTAEKRFAFLHHARACSVPWTVPFWKKVDKSAGPEACWPYQGRIDALGYGRYGRAGPLAFAHRAAYIAWNGAIPEGMDICHHCDNRRCCNPNHFFLGTHQDNMADMKAKDRHTRGERNPFAALTERDVLEIRRDYRKTGRQSSNIGELMKRYPSVSRCAIYFAAIGRTWKHLPMPKA